MNSAALVAFGPLVGTGQYQAQTTSLIEEQLRAGAVVALGISGGKDSVAMAHAVVQYLDSIGHTGPRVLVHCDLGLIEWRSTLQLCHDVAEQFGLELLVCRPLREMIESWKARWQRNLSRYSKLGCAKLILPFPTAGMRFCTADKVRAICDALTERYPGHVILSATGVRGEESGKRARMPVCAPQPKLTRAKKKCSGYNWNAIHHWTEEEVFAYIDEHGLPLHEVYSVYGGSRLSCSLCVLASERDLLAALRCKDNWPAFRAIVDLEIKSGFSFQGNGKDRHKWLADLGHHILDADTLSALAAAKERAAARQAIEDLYPVDLLYEKGWPKRVPSPHEAEIVAAVRREVAKVQGVEVQYTTADEVIRRFQELKDLKDSREEKT